MGAVNPGIALAVNPPAQPQGPLQQAQGAMSLQALINQSKLQQQVEQQNAQKIQSDQITLQQQQQDQQDQQALREAFRASGGDWDKTMTAAQSAGVSPQKLMALQNQRLTQQTSMATLDKDLLANEAAKHAQIAQDAQAVLNLPADQRQDKWTQLANGHYLAGTFKPGEIPTAVPDENGLMDIRNQSKEVLDNLTAAQKLKEANEKDPQVQADAAAGKFRTGASILSNAKSDPEYQSRLKFLQAQGYNAQDLAQYPKTFDLATTPQQLNDMALSPEDKAKLQGTGTFDTNRYIAIQAARQQGQPVSAQDAAWAKGYEKNKELNVTTRFALSAQNPLIPGSGGAGGGGGTAAGGSGGATAPAAPTIGQAPPQIRGTVQEILDNRAPMPPQGRANPTNQAIRYWVNAIDPQYDETNYPAKNEVVKKYVADAGSGQIGAINTALGHLSELEQARQAAANSDIPLLNSIASRLGVAIGSDARTTYTAILHRVGPEMTTAYVKGGGGEGERGANEDDFSLDKGDQQIKTNIAESAKLLNSKLASLRNNWNNEYKPHRPEDDFDQRFITPDARQAIATLAGGAPGGANYTGNSHVAGGSSNGLKEGATGKGSDGKNYIVKGGKWVLATGQ